MWPSSPYWACWFSFCWSACCPVWSKWRRGPRGLLPLRNLPKTLAKRMKERPSDRLERQLTVWWWRRWSVSWYNTGILVPYLQVVKNITKLSEHSQADVTEKSQSTEVDIKVRLCDVSTHKTVCLRGFNSVSVFMLFCAFRQLQLFQNATARAPPLTSTKWITSVQVSALCSGSLCEKNNDFHYISIGLWSPEWLRTEIYFWPAALP